MMPGMIMLWHGALVDIPSGWALCDGTNGTPNLRGFFIMGSGEGIAPGSTGGNVYHTHEFTGDGHAHDLNAGNEIENVEPAGDWDHHTETNPSTGETDNGLSYPPYVALAYIMKLSLP